MKKLIKHINFALCIGLVVLGFTGCCNSGNEKVKSNNNDIADNIEGYSACLNNVPELRKVISLYEMKNNFNSLETLDMGALKIPEKLKNRLGKCNYYSNGNLAIDGEIVCKIHGTPCNIRKNLIKPALEKYKKEQNVDMKKIEMHILSKYAGLPEFKFVSCNYIVDDSGAVKCIYHDLKEYDKISELEYFPNIINAKEQMCKLNTYKIDKAVQYYNKDDKNNEKMTKLDLDKLHKSGCFIQPIIKFDQKCNYEIKYSEQFGINQVICNFHNKR